MERTTIYLEPALKRQLREMATRRGATEAALIREALRSYLGRAGRPKLRPVGRSRDGGIAERVDEALDELGFGRK
jgi:hypothetical protein